LFIEYVNNLKLAYIYKINTTFSLIVALLKYIQLEDVYNSIHMYTRIYYVDNLNLTFFLDIFTLVYHKGVLMILSISIRFDSLLGSCILYVKKIK